MRIVSHLRSWCLASSLVLAVAACEKADQMAWARAALERNPQLEIVGTDANTRSFTVRDRTTGQLRVVSADEITAALPAATGSATAAAQPASQAAATETTPEPSAAPVPEDAGKPASDESPEEPRTRIAEITPTPSAAANRDEGGRVIASGPGYSIKAASPAAREASSAAQLAREATERRSEPLVCQGSRFLRIDGRSIAFEGDALRAEDGCELYITNSRIVANGVGLQARGANVHIKNSTVAGEAGAIHASGNTQIYTESSRFRGMVRRLDEAVVHDMGNNVWN